MNAIEHLESHIWRHPKDYGGHSPIGDYLVYSQTRDSDSVTRSNYACILEALLDLAKQHDKENDEPSVYDFRAGHWAVGWVEYIIVKRNAPEPVKQLAGEFICSISDYPIWDEEHHSELEWNEACEYWRQLGVRERAEYIKRAQCGASIFAARRDDLPSDDNGSLLDLLRSN